MRTFASLFTLCMLAAPAFGAGYPEKPAKLVIPCGFGGASGNIAMETVAHGSRLHLSMELLKSMAHIELVQLSGARVD